VPDYVRRGGATYRVISDQLGSPRYVVNVSNASDVPFTATYTSFGEVTGTGLDWVPFGFAGGMRDGESGLIRFGARDLSAATGRWTSKDPLAFRAGINFYAYADNDPINQQDPSGRSIVCHTVASQVCKWVSGGTGAAGFIACFLVSRLVCDTFPMDSSDPDMSGYCTYGDQVSGQCVCREPPPEQCEPQPWDEPVCQEQVCSEQDPQEPICE